MYRVARLNMPHILGICVIFISGSLSGKSGGKARRQTSHPIDWRRLIADDSFTYSVRHYKQSPTAVSSISSDIDSSPAGPVHRDDLLEGDIIQYVPVYNHHHVSISDKKLKFRTSVKLTYMYFIL